MTKAIAKRPAATATKRAVDKPSRKAATPASQPLAAATVAQVPAKAKLVRDSFTIPKAEYAVLDALKLRTATLGRPAKKSEVLRAGIAALAAMSDKALVKALDGVPSLKTGRPRSIEADPAAE